MDEAEQETWPDTTLACQFGMPLGAHCSHWLGAFGPCCACQRASWLPPGETTMTAAARTEFERYARSCPTGER